MDPQDAGNGGDGPNGSPPRSKIPKLNTASRTMAFWLVIVLLVIASTRLMQGAGPPRINLAYSEFKGEVRADNVAEVTIIEQEIRGRLRTAIIPPGAPETYLSDRFETYAPPGDDSLMEDLQDHGVLVRAQEQRVRWTTALITWLPIVLILFFWIYLMRQMQMGGNRAFSFGKSRARLLTDNRPKVTFNDVAGIDEAKAELQEIVEFLREPAKFQKLGGKIPKGVLLLGSPGTGKTLLARAIAGEADVPFFSMSGSDFVEMFVGVGASRVRDLFEQGKKQAPCIIFIDEIDAVGRHRGAGLGGGHDEREQTLNQLLVEMDGFESNEGVILVAATNRPDVLDPALLRPGRFDRQVVVDRPDVKGREGILKIHSGKVPLADDVELVRVARGTPGFSGADLANLVNEAALLAARDSQDVVSMAYLEEARDKVMMGAERKSLILDEDERRKTAYHEAGHALVRWLIPDADPLHKVTIIPRGRALGITWHLPVRDRYSITRTECQDEIACMLGGRVAEQIIFGEFTTGAGDDLKKVTERARKMVCEWGMSERIGPLTFGDKQEEVFLGREIAQNRDYSEKTAVAIDEEVRRIVDEQDARVQEQLKENRELLVCLAESLLERESLDGAEVDILLNGGTLEPVSDPDPDPDPDPDADADIASAPMDMVEAPVADVDAAGTERSPGSEGVDPVQGELPLADMGRGDEEEIPASRDPEAGNGQVGTPATSDDGGSGQQA